jgi:hypothetical protein
MAEKIQIKLHGVWKDLQSLRLDAQLITATGDVTFVANIAYTIPPSDNPDQTDWVGFVTANRDSLPVSKEFFDLATVSAADYQKWASPAWIYLSAVGGSPPGKPFPAMARVEIKVRVMVRTVGDNDEHQYKGIYLDNSNWVVAITQQEFQINTRTSS